MKHAEIDTKRIGTWFPPGVGWDPKKIQSLTDLIKSNGWGRIPRVPVYELPDKLVAEHKYLLADGHKRRYVASKLGILLPCAVYQPEEIIDAERDGLDPFDYLGNPDGSEHYKEVLTLYQDPTIVEKWIVRTGKTLWTGPYSE